MVLTIDIPTADEPRVTEAFGSILNLPDPATDVDIEGALVIWMNNQTQDYERRKNMQTFVPPPLEMLPPPEPGP